MSKKSIIVEAAQKIYPYFTPNCSNLPRFIGLCGAVIVLPAVAGFMPHVLLGRGDSESQKNNIDVTTALASASAMALLVGLQQGLTVMLSTSTMQAIRGHNIKRLMDDESKFLVHADTDGIKSLQLVTAGVGVRDFANNAIPVFIGLPMYCSSLASTFGYIAHSTDYVTFFEVLGFGVAAVLASGVLMLCYTAYLGSNQRIENDIVKRITFIEENRIAIGLMGLADVEYDTVMYDVNKVNQTIAKLTLLCFSAYCVISLTPAVASHFLGGYDKNDAVQKLSATDMNTLNVMIMSCVGNIQSLVTILTFNRTYIGVNLEQLKAFDEEYDHCVELRKHNNVLQKYEGNCFKLEAFTISRPSDDDSNVLTHILHNVDLELRSHAVYHLSADSGKGKTTMLKAITNNGLYTDGVVTFPSSAEGKVCFVPQHSFFPPSKTLMEILYYPNKPKGSNVQDRRTADDYAEGDSLLVNAATTPIMADAALRGVTEYLRKVGLMPSRIKPQDLESDEKDWVGSLSGGEKQKISIIRAMLSGASFIILDEATSELDVDSKIACYKALREYVQQFENYVVVCVDHSITSGFADMTLRIVGDSLVCDSTVA